MCPASKPKYASACVLYIRVCMCKHGYTEFCIENVASEVYERLGVNSFRRQLESGGDKRMDKTLVLEAMGTF